MANIFDNVHSDSIGTKLPQEVSRDVVVQAVAASTLLPMVDVRQINGDSAKFTRVFTNDTLGLEHIAAECTAAANDKRINGTPTVVNTEQYKCRFQWSYESIENLIVESRLGQSNNDVTASGLQDISWQGRATEMFFKMMTDQLRRDLEVLGTQADVAAATSPLNSQDGWYKLAAANQLLDVASAPLDENVVKNALDLLPSYVSNIQDYVMMVPRSNFYNFAASLGGRQTALGDRLIIDGVRSNIEAMPIFGVPVIVNHSLPANSALLVPRGNLGMAISRDWLLESEKDIDLGCIKAVASIRVGFFTHNAELNIALENLA